jgi:hypothetical protein
VSDFKERCVSATFTSTIISLPTYFPAKQAPTTSAFNFSGTNFSQLKFSSLLIFAPPHLQATLFSLAHFSAKVISFRYFKSSGEKTSHC